MNPNYSGETTLPPKVTQTVCFEAPQDALVMDSSVSVHKEYALGEEIARGGMGRIYIGIDPKLKREVAVKVSTAGQSGEDSMFFKEAKVLGSLAHPNIVPIHNLGEDRHGRPFYSMKLVKGRTLQSVLKGLSRRNAPKTKRYSRAALISVFKKVCDAVAFAHSRRYLHRDIKPENVMLGEYGEVLLMDWGLAQEMVGPESVSECAPTSGVGAEPSQKVYIQGTPTYMSPEQANGAPLDVRSDIYALGGVLFSLLTYRSPVEGKSVKEILSKVRTGEILPMDWLRAAPYQHLLGAAREKEVSQTRGGAYRRRFGLRMAVPTALKALTCKAMAFNREDRYQSVAEMLEDIEAYQNGFATEAEQAGLLRQILLLVRRHRAAAAFAVLLLICAAVFTAQLAASEQRANESALLAKKEAQRAMASEQEAKVNTQEAHKQAGIARANASRVLEEKEAARVLEAGAQLSLASVAEDQAHGMEMQSALARVPEDLREQPWRYLNQKLNTSTKAFDSRGVSVWRDCVPHPLNKNLLVTLQSNGWIRSLDLSTGAVTDLFRIDPAGLKNCLAVSQDGKRVAVHRQISEPSPPRIGSQNLEVFNLADGQTQCSFMMPEDTELGFRGRLVFSPDGNLLLLSSNQEVGFYMFDAWQGTLLWSGTQKCHAIAGFSNKGNDAMICTDREGISQRDSWTGKVLRSSPKAKLGGWKNINIANPSWASVFFVRNGYCFNMEAEGGKVVAKFPLPAGASFIGEIAFLPEQNVLGVIAEQSPQFGILQFWNVDTGDLLRTVPVSTGTDSGRTPDNARWAIVANPKTGQFVVTRGTQMKVWSFPSGHGEKVLPINSETKGDSFVFLKKPDFVAGAFRVSG
ncbi:MAG: protein kinase, partial [Verrucomicrobiota bacterium]